MTALRSPPIYPDKSSDTSRSANHAIQGYLYQFLVTIEQILLSNDNQEHTIEGIEDIDIASDDETQLFQIKYHEAQNFSPSKIYEPIGYMFHHFLNDQDALITYTLYAYFANKTENMTTDIFTEEYLNKCLKKISKDNETFSSKNINGFKKKFKFVEAKKYNDVCSSIKEELKNTLSCDSDDVEKYFYNNALVLIAEMAKEKTASNREITKAQFLLRINHKQHLFRKWLLESKSEEAYIKHIKTIATPLKLTQDVKNKYLIIGKHLLDNKQSDYSILNLIDDLRLTPQKHNYEYKLWTVILDTTDEEIKEIKSDLISKDIYFNDGYENIRFSSNYFNRPHHLSRTHYRIQDASFFIKLISLQTYQNNFYTENIDVLINLSNLLNQENRETLINANNTQYFEIQHIKKLISVKQVLNLQ